MSSPAAVSPLTNKLVPNPNYSKYADRNGGRPEFVVPHHAAGTGSAENIILYDKRIGLSTHYAVDRNTIANAVSEIHGSYSAGNTEWNKKSVSFEMSNDGGAATNWHIHEGTVENAA
ncbi:MAG: N-acetylmuramoyl-L-alanine amidase, partial [Clostridiales Family XIII bacterium]|nr:N-acetylmuramoyl-L-alanine amidase [Clostridiales Family XIII bacterium]